MCKACAGAFETRDNPKGRARVYCSTACYHKGRIGQETRRWPKDHPYVCVGCGVGFRAAADRRRRYCTSSCGYAHRTGENHPNWRGGRFATKQGYIKVCTENGSEHEHRVIAARALGRPLTALETVHHINGNKQDNDRRNLLVCTNSYHRELERRMATLYQRENFPAYQMAI